MSLGLPSLFGAALLCSVMLLAGFGAYLLLWWMERRFYGLASTFGALATLPLVGLMLAQIFLGFREMNWFQGLTGVVILAAILLAALTQSGKYDQPLLEAWLLLSAGLLPGCILIVVLSPLFAWDGGLSRQDRVGQLLACLVLLSYPIGFLSGPLLWNHCMVGLHRSTQWFLALSNNLSPAGAPPREQ